MSAFDSRLHPLLLHLNLLGFEAVGAIYNTARADMISRQNVHVALGAVMIVSLALIIVTFPVVLIWFGQPIGNTAAQTADVSAAVFSVAFFAAFALATIEQRWRYRARRDNP